MEKYLPFIWIGVAVVMAIVEASTTQLVSVWFVVGALAAALTTIFTDSVWIQLAVFLAVSVIALIVTRPLVKRFKKKKQPESTNADRLIGQYGVVITPLADEQSVGQVKVLGEIWSAKSTTLPLEEGDRVRVLRIEGVKLIVEKE